MNRFDNIRVVLVGPLYGGNVGSVCRAMANMGLSDLVLAAPRKLDMSEARMMACAGRGILTSRRECASLAEAVADCGTVAGATARVGLYRAHSHTPRELAPRLLEAAQAAPVALVFGREDNGMTNEELALCTHIVQIPTDAECSSLNLAQAVLICLYEMFVCSGTFEPTEECSEEASSELRERMFAMWRSMLREIGFMTGDKEEHMMMGLRRIFSRGTLTVNDVRIMMGVARQSSWAAKHGSADPSPEQAGPAGRALDEVRP